MRLIHMPKAAKNTNADRKRIRARGVTLVEILVTLVVTSVGLLGVAALHLSSLRNNYDANARTQASTLASDIADRMRSNRMLAVSGSYNVALATTYASPANQAQRDIAEWKTSLGTLLPQGDGSVSVDTGTRVATIAINWTERGAGTMTFTTTTEL